MTPIASTWLKFSALVTIDVAALIGNILMLLVGAKTKSLRVYQNTFIFNVALADLLEATLIMPIALANVASSHQVLYGEWCRLLAALKVTVTLTSVYSLAGVSIQRYFYVVKRKQEMNNARRAIIGVAFVWTISLLFSITPYVGWGRIGFDSNKYVCTAFFHETVSYTIVVFTSALFFNLAVMVFCYTSIFIKFHRQNSMVRIQTGLPILNRLTPEVSRKISWIEQLVAVKRKLSPAPKTSVVFTPSQVYTNNLEVRESYIEYNDNFSIPGRECYVIEEEIRKQKELKYEDSFEEEHETKSPKTSTTELTPKHRYSESGSTNGINSKLTNKEMQLLKTIVVVITVFFACWTPYVVYNILRVFNICEESHFVDTFTMWLGFSNSALNPIIYGVLNGQFRGAMQNIVYGCFSRRVNKK